MERDKYNGQLNSGCLLSECDVIGYHNSPIYRLRYLVEHKKWNSCISGVDTTMYLSRLMTSVPD
jgi:hypothetical protein